MMNDYLWWVSYGIGYSFLLNHYYNRKYNSNYTRLLSRNIISDHKCGNLIESFLYYKYIIEDT